MSQFLLSLQRCRLEDRKGASGLYKSRTRNPESSSLEERRVTRPNLEWSVEKGR